MRYLKYFVKCLLQRQLCFFCFCNRSGLKEYIGANPALKFESSTTVIQSKLSEVSVSNAEFEESEVKDEFYDAMSADSSSSDEELDNKVFLFWFSSSWNGTLFVVQFIASHICIEILFEFQILIATLYTLQDSKLNLALKRTSGLLTSKYF